jgi:hypothetical protein
MSYDDICNLLLNDLLFESLVDRAFLHQLDYDIKELRKNSVGKREEMKPELKELKRKLISKLIKDNYNMLLSKFFPHLRRESRTLEDEEFSNILFNDPNSWRMSMEQEDEFENSLEKTIRYFYTKNHQEYTNLRYLLSDYIPSYSPEE